MYSIDIIGHKSNFYFIDRIMSFCSGVQSTCD